MATGASDMPKEVNIPSLAKYKGRVIHSSGYKSADGFAGRHVTVIGTGTSGHDIAQDLVSNGASVTLVQRSPTLVVNVEPAAQIPYALYSEGRPLEECDLIAVSAPMALAEKSHRLMAVQSREMDRELLADLRRAGFRINDTDERGWQFMFLTRGGGYYFNVGCSELINAGRVPVVQYADIETFTETGWQTRDGKAQATDMVVLDLLSRDADVRRQTKTKADVQRLWEVCQVPDYRKVSPTAHAELALTLFHFVVRAGRVPDEWFQRQLSQFDRTDGEIDTLSARIAQVRTFNFIANRPDWLRDPEHWQGVTRQVEDSLSDALHERLAHRFVDRRTSVLMRRLRENAMLEAEITAPF
jgi:hypothetical protein